MALPQQYQQEQSNPALDALLNKDLYTEDEYFAFEERTPGHWEFIPDRTSINLGFIRAVGSSLGEIRAMSGGNSNHAAISANLIAGLKFALRSAGNRTCRVFSSDLKIHTGDNVNTFPDVSVVCGTLTPYRNRKDVVTNPILVAEIVSPSTEGYDRGNKWQSYQTIATLQHYILVTADRARLEVYTRQEHGWHFEAFEGLDSEVVLSALEISLSLSDVYDLIDLTI